MCGAARGALGAGRPRNRPRPALCGAALRAASPPPFTRARCGAPAHTDTRLCDGWGDWQALDFNNESESCRHPKRPQPRPGIRAAPSAAVQLRWRRRTAAGARARVRACAPGLRCMRCLRCAKRGSIAPYGARGGRGACKRWCRASLRAERATRARSSTWCGVRPCEWWWCGLRVVLRALLTRHRSNGSLSPVPHGRRRLAVQHNPEKRRHRIDRRWRQRGCVGRRRVWQVFAALNPHACLPP